MGAFFAAGVKAPELAGLQETFMSLLQEEKSADCIQFELVQPHFEGELLRRIRTPVLREMVHKVWIHQNGQKTEYDFWL